MIVYYRMHMQHKTFLLLKELEEQNRTITRISKRQEAALKKYHNEETQLPHLLEAHKMEIKILQDKLRKVYNIFFLPFNLYNLNFYLFFFKLLVNEH